MAAVVIEKNEGKNWSRRVWFLRIPLSLLSKDQHKQSKDKCLARCVWGAGKGVPSGSGVTVINFSASWARWLISLLLPPWRAHVYAARGTGKWNRDTFVVQNSLDSRTFAKLKSKIFISQGRMKWENLYLWLMITFFKTVFKLCTTLGRHLYICINSFPWACDQKIARLILIVIAKLACIWLFCGPCVLYIFAGLNFICLGEKNRQFLKETGANNSEETLSKQNKGCGVEVISPI